MKLFFQKMGEGRPLFILHGLFGLSDNWYSIGKKLSSQFCVYIPDMRNHGHSGHSDDMNYEVMSDDLTAFIESENITNPIIVGHSMGGKVALQFALNHSDIPAGLIIIDITAAQYPLHHKKFTQDLLQVNFSDVKERKDIEIQLEQFISEPAVLQLMMKNIQRNDKGRFHWKFNLDAISRNLENIHARIYSENTFKKPAMLLRGTDSEFVKEDSFAETKLLFPLLELSTIENAGHWVQADQPEEVLYKIIRFSEAI
ncbi:MAG: alpha/beta fold hydrolase [Bacteroidota bacterium]